MGVLVIHVGVDVDQVRIKHVEEGDIHFRRKAGDRVVGDLAVIGCGIWDKCQYRCDVVCPAVFHEPSDIAHGERLFFHAGVFGDLGDRDRVLCDADAGFGSFLGCDRGEGAEGFLQVGLRQLRPAVVVGEKWKQQLRLRCFVGMVDVADGCDFGRGQREDVVGFVGEVHAPELCCLGLGPGNVEYRDPGFAEADNISHKPVGGGDGVAVAAPVVGGDAVVFPELHGENGVHHVAGAEEEDVVVGVFGEEGLVLVLAVRALGEVGKVVGAGGAEGQKDHHIEDAAEAAGAAGI